MHGSCSYDKTLWSSSPNPSPSGSWDNMKQGPAREKATKPDHCQDHQNKGSLRICNSQEESKMRLQNIMWDPG